MPHDNPEKRYGDIDIVRRENQELKEELEKWKISMGHMVGYCKKFVSFITGK